MKLPLNYLITPWYRRPSLWLCLFSVFGLGYTLWEREQLLQEYNAIKIAKNDDLQQRSPPTQPQQLVQQQPVLDPSFEKQMVQISTELTLPRGDVLDALQMALVPNIFLTQISLDNQYIVEGVAVDEKSLQKFIQALQSSPVWESVEIESEEAITADGQIPTIVQPMENTPLGKSQTKIKLNLIWKRL